MFRGLSLFLVEQPELARQLLQLPLARFCDSLVESRLLTA
jgi:hypothetical protein